ncbi:hypothetical protein [Nitratidesulfovibrio liaohensis]|uniref:Uncharacterized protein n=1 Tax=Nitratidesulfovibrio liaohensis TaxID=2604158 RepID=A0ABY9R079_9BACT|nr:hypothetical protein [Nitratidesulfovibrio liaohensis]WMW64398.1 hypothetical protein KPS_002410 [Nitratidesulfovibrio liaohensis]
MGAEIIPVMQQLAGDWWGPVTTVVTIASVLCPFLPVPQNPALKVAYKVVQILAANVGKAKNAQDAKK